MVEIKHHSTVEERINEYVEKLEKLGPDAKEKEIIAAISESSLDVYLENEMGFSVCTETTSLRLKDNKDALGVVGWMGVVGFIMAVTKMIRENLAKFKYIPFWRKGSEKRAYSYKFLTKESKWDVETDIFTNFFKRVYVKNNDFGFLFGEIDEEKNKVIIEAVIPVEELADVLEELDKRREKGEMVAVSNAEWTKRDRDAILALNNLIGNVRTGNIKGKENIIYEVIKLLLKKKKHIILTKEKIELLEKTLRPKEKDTTAEICKTSAWEKLAKTGITRRTTYLRGKFLGAYYYEKGILGQAIIPEKVLEQVEIEKVKELCTFKDLPKLLFFNTENFEKIDSVMKGSIPFFVDEKRDNLPILVVLDRNKVTARSMCIAYNTEEEIYKRIRHYVSKKT